jgi:hypothetical protein
MPRRRFGGSATRTHVLFMQANVHTVIENRKIQLKRAINGIDRATIESDSEETLVERLAQEYGFDVPVLDEAGKYAMPPEEVDVVVQYSREGLPLINISGGPVLRRGLKITVVVPFKGQPQLFNVQPTMFDSNPPVVSELNNEDIRLVFTVTEPPFDIDAACANSFSKINRYLNNLRSSAEQLNTELKQIALPLVRRKKQELAGHSQILSSLTIPIRNLAPAPPRSPANQAVVRKSAANIADKWDVFICHATEDKDDIARPLANDLKSKGLDVWYDDFSLKLGDSLRQSIDRGLARSRFGVVILSPHFFEKHWPQEELNGLVTREVGGQKVILPVWHRVGFAEVSGYSPTLANKKAALTDQGLQHVVEKILEVVLV